MKIIVMLELLCVVVFFGQLLIALETESPEIKSTYLVLYKPGPNWPPEQPVSALPLKEHGKYLLNLYADGKMKSAGPFPGTEGAAVVLEVTDESEAEAIVLEDPAVKSGFFLYEIHMWNLVDWEKYLKK
jgi:uncharacterized protein